MRSFAITLLIVAITAGCSGDSSIQITESVIAEPASSVTALYFDVRNPGEADRLIGARTDIASASIHRSYLEDNQMHMESISGVDIESGETVSFEPGGYHVMLMEVEPVGAGQTVIVILEFEKAGDIEIAATVKQYADIAP